MPIPQPSILQFINKSDGTIEGIGEDADLHWDISERMAWLSKGKSGEKTFATDGESGEVRNLWFAVKNLTDAFIDRKPYPVADLEFLNSWAAKPDLIPTIGTNGLVFSCPSFSTALAWIAVEAAYLLGCTQRGQIRRCPGCSMVFFDPSPTGRRRWCSMSRCGNRNKVRAFNARNSSGTSI